jgi:MFS family permease
LLVKLPFHIYIVEAIYGVGIGFTAPPWYAIFSRHLDKLSESFEWTLDSISIGLGAAAAAAAGGAIAQRFGFHSVFIFGGFLAIFGGAMQIFIFKNIKKKVPRGQVKPEPGKVAIE